MLFASAAAAALAAVGQPQLTSQLIRLRDSGRTEEMVQLAKEAINHGNRDEFVLRTCSWGLRILRRPEEARPVAEMNWSVNRTPWSLAELIQAQTDTGDYDAARDNLRFALRHRSEWGSAKGEYNVILNRLSTLVWQASWTIDPVKILGDNKQGVIRIPIPVSGRDYQHAETKLTGAASQKMSIIDGQSSIEAVPEGTDKMVLTSTIRIIPTSYRALAKTSSGAIPEAVRRFLESSPSVDWKSPAVLAIAEKLKGATNFETVNNVLNWVNGQIKYNGDGGGIAAGGSASTVLARRTGHCEAITTSAVALLRANGIPARYIRGHGAWVPGARAPSWHTITEFYYPGIGWIPWDHNYQPFVVRSTFLATYSYGSPGTTGEGDRPLKDLWKFQVLGDPKEFVAVKLVGREFDGQRIPG